MTGRRLALATCALAAILLHLPTWSHEFVFDDRAVIAQNPLMRDLRFLPSLLTTPYWPNRPAAQGLYRPLTSVSFALNRALAGGMDARWFHLVNALLHGLATLLVTMLAFEILPGGRAPTLAGMLFAVHPVHVEAVAGIVGRGEILAACGVLGAVLAHRQALRAPRTATGWMIASWGAYFLGMMAKESAVAGLVLCALADRTVPDAGIDRRRRRWVLYAGHLGALGAYLVVRVLVLGRLGVGEPIPFVDNPAASAGPLAGRLTALGTVARYAGLLLWPRHLSADYSYDQIPVIRSAADPLALGGGLLILILLAAGIRTLRRSPAWGCALLWIPASAALTSNLPFFIGTLQAERLMYLPSVGLCLLAGLAVGAAPSRRGPRTAAVLLALSAVLGGAARTLARLPQWRDDFSLYSSAALVSPRSARIRYNLGNAYLRLTEYREAEENLRAALAIYPEFKDAKVNLGMTLLESGRPREALGLLKSAADDAPANPDLAVNLGSAYQALGDDERAEVEFRRALSLDPRSARAWNNLGSIHLRRGENSPAIECLEKAVHEDPDAAIFRINLADALNGASRGPEAEVQFEEAYRLEPNLPESRRGLGEVALQRGDLVTAEREFRAAVAVPQPSARACNFLGYLLATRGDYRAAVEFYDSAVRIDPTLYDAHRSLGLLYAHQLRDPALAARHLGLSLELAPLQPGADELRRLLHDLGRSPSRGSGP